MRVKLQRVPNPNIVIIHLDRRLTTEMIRAWDCPERDGSIDKMRGLTKPVYIDRIFALPGVESITMSQHDLRVAKAELFDWSGIVPATLMILLEEFEPDGKIILDGKIIEVELLILVQHSRLRLEA